MPTEVRTTTKGQTTRSQKTQVCVPAIKVEVGVPSVDKPAVKLVVGGRHPHPPSGNNKKLKHKVQKAVCKDECVSVCVGGCVGVGWRWAILCKN